MTTTNRPELRPVLDRFQNPKKADAGATHQGDPIPMKECAKCLGKVVWVKSTKTGKFYLADCFRYSGGESYFYIKASPHFKTCEQRVATNERHRQEETDRIEHETRWQAARSELKACAERWRLTGSDGYEKDPAYLNEWNEILIRHGFQHMALTEQQ